MEHHLASNVGNICYYLADNFEDEFMSATNDTYLNFSSKASYIETTSMMGDVGSNIYSLCIFLRILRYKLWSKLFELDYKIIDVCREIILPQFVEYSYTHEVESKSKLIWF